MQKKHKKPTHVSEYMGIPYKGHAHFKFVDVRLNQDNRLFLDPCLIELGQDEWCRKAAVTMQKYFDCLFAAIRTGTLSSSNLLAHAHEQNATKLGYGNGENGKGKTPDGLFESLAPLFPLTHQIPTISKPEDIPLLVYKFGEDNWSDLLTNAFGIDGRGRAGCGKNASADAETAKAAGCAAGYGIAACAAGGSGCVFAQPQGKYDFRRHSLFESGISEGAVSGGAADGAAARDGQ